MKKLKRQQPGPPEWVDELVNGQAFHGVVPRDLNPGDEYEHKGKWMKVKEKKTTPNGFEIVVSQEVGSVG